MFFTTSLYIALTVFGIGLLYKMSTWFRYKIGLKAREIPTASRVFAAVKGIILTLFSPKMFILLKVFVLDVLVQTRILREDFLRWLMHICLYLGFMLLLLMHALDKFLTSALFPGYYSTLNPFLFLRDFFGVLVIIGIAIAIYRRFILKLPHLRSNVQDHYAIIILAVIMISGVLLEGSKIVSYTRYQEMVEEFALGAGPSELRALEAYWVKENGVVSPNIRGPVDAETLALGKDMHEMNCLQCHSRPQSAFLGYGTAVIIRPLALALDKAGMPRILWYLHFLACWLGLAYLPFSKMFHIFASPLSLLASAVMDKGKSSPANIATRQVMELDACTHCGTCTSRCSVAVVFGEIPNLNILPSEKIASVKELAAGRELSAEKLRHIQEGIYLCTNCRRCTVVCPAGINLQDLWFNVRETLLHEGYPELLALSPFSYYRGLMREELADDNYPKPLHRARDAIAAECGLLKARDQALALTPTDKGFKSGLSLSAQANSFSVCFGCETCTTVCPVVANFDNPQEVLDLLPHQIMHSCGLGLRDLALGSNMLWDCLTCYQCQEQCPQGVCVTDVLYELKNRAVQHLKDKPQQQMGRSV
jgi:heterodisulfide reductase subunit C/nitrate reductase gamma subunit